ncbi:MAG TPA: glycosyl hydrolase family 28 protein [Verrucomicrobiae bacterium]|nr:glycosyl hydrolase family 28 protein [Verrucomicrobiae bacterium]
MGILVATAVWGTPTLPNINTNNVFNVTTYGAATGNSDNAADIQAAINAASAASGGGTVEIPGPGTYLSGPLTLKSKVNLQIDSGATLMMLPKSSWPGTTTFILGSSVSDVEISGAGTIDGQGAGWWGSSSRPNFIQFTSSHRILIQSSTPQNPFTGMVNALTLQNPPTFHLMLKNNNGDITILGLDINTDPTSPNTDGMDVGSTNMLVQNCHISDGDDNIELGGSSALARDIMITNCMFGHGHGVSVGSLTQAGVSNVTVINCIFTNTDNAIRMKSDAGSGGVVQNMSYYNIGMTNIKYAPILIYSYYSSYGNPTTAGITPSVAAGTAVGTVSSTTPVWRNIVISNVTATAAQPGMIWSRTELPASNIILSKLNITSTDSSAGDSAFALYNVRGLQVVDSQIHPAGSYTFEMFNSQVTFTNSALGASTITLDGTSVTNALGFYNQSASLSDSTLFGAIPISLGGSTLSDGTSLTLAATTPMNFTLGTNLAKVSVTGNLSLNSTLNIAAGGGFAPGTYTLFTYSGSRSGSPTLGTTPAGYTYQLNTGTAGQVNLVVTSTNNSPSAPTGLTATAGNAQVTLTWNASSGAISYNVKRATVSGTESVTNATVTTTNYIDMQVTNGAAYYYVVSAVNAGGESANSSEVSATPQPPPPSAPTGLTATAGNAQVTLTWNASSGAISYNVKRATVSGNESVTNATVTTTNYSDMQVTNGVTYYYVVSAVNAGGESANTLEVSATPQPPSPPVFGGISINSNGLVLSGTGGTTNGTYYVLVSTNLALPPNQWTPVTTNVFDAGGNFIFTNAINADSPQAFYRLQVP